MIQPTGPEQAKIMIVGEFAHEQDILRNAPFIGGAGYELTKMLMEAGIVREQCFLTLVCRTRAPGGRTEGLVAESKKYVTSQHILHNGKWVLPVVMEGLELLRREIERVKPNVVIAMGNLALWALTGEWGVTNWRSSVMESNLVPGQKVIPTLNPSMVLVNWPSRPMVVHDLKRAKRQSAFPEIIRTDYNLVIRPNYEKAVQVLTLLLEAADDAIANRVTQGKAAEESALYRQLLGMAGSTSQQQQVWVGQLPGEGGLSSLRSMEAVEGGNSPQHAPCTFLREDAVHQSSASSHSDPTGKCDGQESNSPSEVILYSRGASGNMANAACGGVLHRDRGYTEPEFLQLRDSIQKNVKGGEPLRIGADIETRAGHIACIAFAWSKSEAICIPLMCVSNPEGYWTEEQETELVWLMCQILMRAHIIGQNWNYDATYIYHFWHHLAPLVTDTMIQQHSCFSNLEKGLAYLSSMYCEDHLYWKDDRTNWTEGPSGEGEDQYWIYNCTDAVRTLAINEVLDAVIVSLGVVEVNRFQQHLRYLALKCMNTGFLIHEENRRNFSFSMLDEVAKRNAFIEYVVGHPLNIQSPLQMQQFFYGEMAMTPIKDKKTGSNTTNDVALQVIAQREPILAPMCRKIAELRTLKVLHSTFIEAGVDRDGRMRTSFNVAGTDTYRFASKKNPFGGGCFPPGAEVLAPQGWIPLETMPADTTIAAYEPSQGKLLWQTAQPYSEDFEGQLLRAKSSQYHSLVTPGHRLLSAKAGRNDYIARPAAMLAGGSSRYMIPISGELQEGSLRFSHEKLLVAALADGTYEDNRVRFNLKRNRKCVRLEILCKRYGIELHETKTTQNDERRFWFYRPTDWPQEKKWGWWILNLTQEAAQTMLAECRHWDSHSVGDSFLFFSASKEQAEIVHTLAHIAGSGATLRTQEQSANSYSDTLMHVVNVKPRTTIGLEKQHWSQEPYSGKVYCVTVPTSFFLVRQNGFVSVTGNCNFENVTKGGETEDGLEVPNVRRIFRPDPGHTIFDTDLDSADLRIVTWESNCQWMKEQFANGRKPYVEVMKEYYRDQSKSKNSKEYPMFKALCHGCLTAGHEVLTAHGWVRIEEYDGTSPIMTWDKENWKAELSSPEGFFQGQGNHLVHLEGQSYSMTVTHDHRVPYTVDKPENIRVRSAIDLPNSARIPMCGYLDGPEQVTTREARLLAAFQADGSIFEAGHVTFNFHRQRKIDRLHNLLEGRSYTESNGRFYIPRESASFSLFGKIAGSYLLQWSAEALDAFLDELQYWDGSSTGTILCHVTTIHKSHADWIQTIAKLRGYGSQVEVQREAEGNKQKLWRVSLNHRQFFNLSSGSAKSEKILQGSVNIYCPMTKTGFFFVRRNGKIGVTGNTNYLGTAEGIAPRIGLLVHETERIQKWYYGMCPEIRKWQDEIKKQVAGRRFIQNAYGYKFHFFDRIQGTIFNQAVAWIPQSTVSCLINRIWQRIDDNLPEVVILNQVHDSLVGQFETHLGDWAKRRIIEESNIPIPYADPLFIPMGISTSQLSWGDCT